MKLIKQDKQDFLLKRFGATISNPRFLFLLSFILYNLIILGIASSLFYREIPYSRRQSIMNSLKANMNLSGSWSLPGSNIPPKVDPEQLSIDIGAQQLTVLNEMTASSFEKGHRPPTHQRSVPATIRYQNESYEVDLSAKGLPVVYRENEGPGSFNVAIKGDKPLLGMQQFSLYAPQGPECLNEWLRRQLLTEAGLISGHYDLVEVALNDQNRRIYVLEQKVENDQPREGQIIGLDPVSESGNDGPAAEVLNLLRDFQQNERSVSRAFDVQKLAAYFALIDLFGGQPPLSLDDLRFYFNPDASVLEPVINDKAHLGLLANNSLLGAERPLGRPAESFSPEPWLNLHAFYEAAFGDPDFFKAYVQALERLADRSFLDAFTEKQEGRFRAMQKILLREYPHFKADPFPVLYENQEFIRRALKPSKLIQAYFNKGKSSDKTIHLEVSNIFFMPVEIKGAGIGDSIWLAPAKPEILPANVLMTPAGYQTLELDLPDTLTWTDERLKGLQLHFSILGAAGVAHSEINLVSIINQDLLEDDLMRKKPNIHDFDFLQIDDQQKQIRIKTGTHQLNKTLIIPRSYQVTAFGGTEIDMTNEAIILSYSPLQFTGSEQEPITVYSSDSTGQGIVVLYAREPSRLVNVHFQNMSNPTHNNWSLTSAVTFYESPVSIDRCLFVDNLRGDDYLNVVRCDFSMKNTLFLNAFADAFDGDFCTGVIENTRFINAGNDAIDVSGSTLAIAKIEIEKTGDKGLSAGENSTMEAREVIIKDAELAVTSKDLSRIKIEDIEIQDSRIAYSAFQKKPEYGPATIEVVNNSTIAGQNEILYLIESGSMMTIAGKKISSSIEMDHVKQILYGVKYGKSSR